MSSISENNPSVFAMLVDKLKDKSEEELKLLSIKFFSTELADEWASITASSNFGNSTEEDIVNAILKKRYNTKNV